jgi:hypothetical protein
LIRSIGKYTLAGLAISVFSAAASSQQILSPFFPAIETRSTTLAPNFRVADYRAADSSEEVAAPDTPPGDADAANPPKSAEQEGLVRRSIRRIGQDQKRLYLAPFERHNLKWDAFVLVGTGALIAADSHIEPHISTANFQTYQNISNAAIYGLAASVGGIYLYGIKTDHPHARETGDLELETLVNTFLIYTPLQLIFGRQRPGEGAGNGDFFKHHAINTSFPGGHAMFTFAMASVLADEYPKPWARILAYGAATTVTVTRFLARDHYASDMFIGAALGTAIAENVFHARCDPDLPSQCKRHQRWWKPMGMETQ